MVGGMSRDFKERLIEKVKFDSVIVRLIRSKEAASCVASRCICMPVYPNHVETRALG